MEGCEDLIQRMLCLIHTRYMVAPGTWYDVWYLGRSVVQQLFVALLVYIWTVILVWGICVFGLH